MKRGKALCRILAVLLICALVAGFAPVAETISAPAQETAAGAEPAETVTDVLPSGADGDPDAAKDPGETKGQGETKDPGEAPNPGEPKDSGETPDPSEPTNPDETPTVPTIVSAKDTNEAVWAQKRTVTIQTAGPVDKVQYRVKGTKKWQNAAGENGVYTFELTKSSDTVVTYEVRALNGEQESETFTVDVGKIDTTAPKVTVKGSYAYPNDRNWTVTILDKQSGLDVDSIGIRAFYEKDGRQYLPENQDVIALNQALETQKTNYKSDKKSDEFKVSFTLPRFYNFHLVKVEVTVRDKAGNEGGHNRPSDPEQYGSIAATLNPSLYSVSKGRYLVGDQGTLKIDGVATDEQVSLFVDGTLISENVDVEKPFLLGQFLREAEGVHTITFVSDRDKECVLPVYHVSGAPAVHSVDFYNGSAIKNFIHTITGGLMFAKNNELKIEPETGNAAGETVGAAYFWQTGDKVATPDNPALTMETGTVVLDSQEQQWVAVDDKRDGNNRAPWLIPCPDKDFSGYLHVVVWNEVGTCSERYTYKYNSDGDVATRLTNLGVAYGANNGVAVFVTTPDGEKVKPYTPKRDVLDENNNPTEEPNWVQQVDFDVQWDESKLATWLKEWAQIQDAYKDTVQNGIGDSYDWKSFNLDAENGVVVTATVKAEDGKTTEDKEVVSGQNSGQAKSFTLGGAVGEDGKNEISRNSPVQFTVTVSATVQKTTTTKNADGTTSESQPQPIDVKESFTTEKIPVYVQNYLNVPTVTAVSKPKTADGETSGATRTNKEIEQCWFNGNDNVLKSLVITESGKSTAPYTLSYTLRRPSDDPQAEPSVNGEASFSDHEDTSVLPVYNKDNKNNFNEDGVYTLTVEATDAAGNKSETAAYKIKYDVSAPDVSAVFSLTSKDSPFYAEQRTIDIEVSDKLFEGSKNVTFEEGKPVSGNGVYTLTGTMKNTNQSGVSNVSIETTIQYTNGNPPMFDGAWTYTGAGEGKQTLPSWSGTYKYGSVDGNIRDGDDYTLCIKATDEAGNVTKTNTDGTYTKNGKEPTGVGSSSNCYTVVTKGTDKTDFTIDQTNPKVSVRFDNNSVVNGKYFPAGRTATITVVEHNFDRNRVELTATGSSGSTDWVDDGDTHTATVSFLNDADCKFAIRVKDKAGNICENDAVDYGGNAAPGEFVIDTTAPTLALTGVNGPFADACTPGFEGQDANMSTEYELHLMRSVRENAADDATALCSRELVNISTTDIRAVFQNIPDMLDNAEYYSDGIYKLSVTIRDMADNTTTQEATFAVNRHGSFYIYGEALANLVTKQFAQNDFVDAQTGAWTIMEYNASPVQPDSVQLQIYRDNALVTSVTPEIRGGMDDATGLYRYVYELDRNMFAQDGLYKVQVRSTDEAGNLSENIDEVDDNGNVTTPEKYQCTLSFVIDNVDPEFKQITGLEKKRYREDSHEINFAVADTYGLARVSVLSGETVVAEYLCAAEVDALGGETKLAANQKLMPNELTLESVSGDVMLQGGKSAQTITFVAVDKAGNTYTTGSADQKPLSFHQKVTISTNGFVLYIHNTWAVVLTVVALAAIAFGVWYGVSKKKKREGAAS